MGISWEKLFFSWEKLGTFSNGFQAVTRKVGNFVGITFFLWEKLGNNLGKSREKVGGEVRGF